MNPTTCIAFPDETDVHGIRDHLSHEPRGLGNESNVGRASGDHLHFEIGVPRASNSVDDQSEWESALAAGL